MSQPFCFLFFYFWFCFMFFMVLSFKVCKPILFLFLYLKDSTYVCLLCVIQVILLYNLAQIAL